MTSLFVISPHHITAGSWEASVELYGAHKKTSRVIRVQGCYNIMMEVANSPAEVLAI